MAGERRVAHCCGTSTPWYSPCRTKHAPSVVDPLKCLLCGHYVECPRTTLEGA